MPEGTREEHAASPVVLGLMCSGMIGVAAFGMLVATIGVVQAFVLASLAGSVGLLLPRAASFTGEMPDLDRSGGTARSDLSGLADSELAEDVM